MGLLLSVLVTCVGVIELLTFYHKFERRLNLPPIQNSLSIVQDRYLKELENVKDRLTLQLHRLKNAEIVSTHTNIPALRLNSCEEDIDVKFLEQVFARSESPSRQFVGIEEQSLNSISEGIKKSRAQECIPEYLIEEPTTSNVPRCDLKDNNDLVPLPSSENFEKPENEKMFKMDVFKKKLGHSNIELDGELYYRRSPSPFPIFDLTVPRNSVCSELLDDSVSVTEVDECFESNFHSCGDVEATYEASDSLTEINNNYEKSDIMLTSATYNSTEYWSHRNFVKPSKECRIFKKPKDILMTDLQRRKSKSESDSLAFKSAIQTCSTVGCSLELLTRDENGIISESKYESDFSFGVKIDTKEANNNLGDLDKVEGCTEGIITRELIQKGLTYRNISDLAEANNSTELPNGKNTNTNNSIKTTSLNENTSNTKPGEPFWLIFSGEYTKAMNKDFHGQHFCCWQCDESLTGQRYVLRDDHPYCVACYESVFANACEKCSRTIGIDSKDLSYKDKHWHEACFLCTTCGESLVDKQFGSKGDRIYCGRCYDEQFASRCDGCHEIFRAGTKKMEYKTRQWHEKCFCCCVCKVPIGTQSFIPREQEIFCAKCYEEKFATRCIKCNKVITSGGVTYKNEPWHRECFTCTNCQKSLAGERFTSRDEKPYCADCFGELFAKRCFACNRPITGIGGTKFISFEDRHWHNDCFFCASCRTSLVGRGFITDQDDIICPECAKQKLM